MSNHYYGDLSNLNAEYDFVPLQGLGAADDPKYPWFVFSKDTQLLQSDMNEGLTAQGGCLLDEDGKIGPKTCGAMQHFSLTMPSTCTNHQSEWVSPTIPCSAAAPPASSNQSTSPATVPTATVKTGGGIPGWAIGLGLGVVAIAAAMILSKKKK